VARFVEPTPEQEIGWKDWVASRPDNVRKVAERFEPWSLYALRHQKVTLVSFGEQEDGRVTLTVNVIGRFNFVLFDRSVFGIDPAELSACELPGKDENVGTIFTEPEDIEAFIDAVRPVPCP
jgi:hypothetical protein